MKRITATTALYMLCTGIALQASILHDYEFPDELNVGPGHWVPAQLHRTVLHESTHPEFSGIDDNFNGTLTMVFTIERITNPTAHGHHMEEAYMGIFLRKGPDPASTENEVTMLMVGRHEGYAMWTASFGGAHATMPLVDPEGKNIPVALSQPETLILTINYVSGGDDTASVFLRGEENVLPPGDYSFTRIIASGAFGEATVPYVNFTEMSVTISGEVGPPPPPPATWAGYPVSDDQVDTGDWLGMVGLLDEGWVHLAGHDTFAHAHPVDDAGVWLFSPFLSSEYFAASSGWSDPGVWPGALEHSRAPWHFSPLLNGWLYIPDTSPDAGCWLFLPKRTAGVDPGLSPEPWLPTMPTGIPYDLPVVREPAEFGNVVYIDPSGPNGNGSFTSPYNTLQYLEIQPDTAYLIRRGTVLTERAYWKVWQNTYVGAYGDGDMPVIMGGIQIGSGSVDATFVGLDIRKAGTGGNDIIFAFNDNAPRARNITVAFCRIIGEDIGSGYPHNALRGGGDDIVIFNCEIAYAQNNGWWLGTSERIRVIRNWFHHHNMGGTDQLDSTGDIIQAIYDLNNAYFAGNIMDKSNSIWKYALMFNIPLSRTTTQNIVVEYNTFFAPKPGQGGAAVRWVAGVNSTFRRNLIDSIGLVTPIDTWDPHANQPEPYGIRDNHILANPGSGIATNGVVLHESNRVFRSHSAYADFLADNPELHGSDIDTERWSAWADE